MQISPTSFFFFNDVTNRNGIRKISSRYRNSSESRTQKVREWNILYLAELSPHYHVKRIPWNIFISTEENSGIYKRLKRPSQVETEMLLSRIIRLNKRQYLFV